LIEMTSRPPKTCKPVHATKVSFLFSDKEIDYMKSYRCRGIDHSILNNYILGHFYDFLVKSVFPSWLAPNVLTLLGPVPAIIASVLIIMNAPTLTEPLPAWLQIYLAFAVFFYLICDNCDGKHARNINCCSPLGDFLDHSLDTITFTLIIHNLCAAFNMSSGWYTYFIIAGCIMTHVFVMWEAYYTGEIILNYIEACTEGIFTVALIHISFAIFGNSVAHAYLIRPGKLSVLPNGLDFQSFLPLFAYSAYFTSLLSVKRVLSVSYKKEGLSPLLPLVPFFFMNGLNALFGYIYSDVAFKHFHRWIFALCSHQMWWVHNLIVAKLTGRRLNFKNCFNVALFLPILLWIVTLTTSATFAIKTVPIFSVIIFISWWCLCVYNYTKKLGKPLLTVPKNKEN